MDITFTDSFDGEIDILYGDPRIFLNFNGIGVQDETEKFTAVCMCCRTVMGVGNIFECQDRIFRNDQFALFAISGNDTAGRFRLQLYRPAVISGKDIFPGESERDTGKIISVVSVDGSSAGCGCIVLECVIDQGRIHGIQIQRAAELVCAVAVKGIIFKQRIVNAPQVHGTAMGIAGGGIEDIVAGECIIADNKFTQPGIHIHRTAVITSGIGDPHFIHSILTENIAGKRHSGYIRCGFTAGNVDRAAARVMSIAGIVSAVKQLIVVVINRAEIGIADLIHSFFGGVGVLQKNRTALPVLNIRIVCKKRIFDAEPVTVHVGSEVDRSPVVTGELNPVSIAAACSGTAIDLQRNIHIGVAGICHKDTRRRLFRAAVLETGISAHDHITATGENHAAGNPVIVEIRIFDRQIKRVIVKIDHTGIIGGNDIGKLGIFDQDIAGENLKKRSVNIRCQHIGSFDIFKGEIAIRTHKTLSEIIAVKIHVAECETPIRFRSKGYCIDPDTDSVDQYFSGGTAIDGQVTIHNDIRRTGDFQFAVLVSIDLCDRHIAGKTDPVLAADRVICRHLLQCFTQTQFTVAVVHRIRTDGHDQFRNTAVRHIKRSITLQSPVELIVRRIRSAGQFTFDRVGTDIIEGGDFFSVFIVTFAAECEFVPFKGTVRPDALCGIFRCAVDQYADVFHFVLDLTGRHGHFCIGGNGKGQRCISRKIFRTDFLIAGNNGFKRHIRDLVFARIEITAGTVCRIFQRHGICHGKNTEIFRKGDHTVLRIFAVNRRETVHRDAHILHTGSRRLAVCADHIYAIPVIFQLVVTIFSHIRIRGSGSVFRRDPGSPVVIICLTVCFAFRQCRTYTHPVRCRVGKNSNSAAFSGSGIQKRITLNHFKMLHISAEYLSGSHTVNIVVLPHKLGLD